MTVERTELSHADLLHHLANALNACERAGLTISLDHGAVITRAGYVLPPDPLQPGANRWSVRRRIPVPV